MADEKFVKTVQSTFSMYGLVLSRKLSVALAKQLLSVEEDERKTWLTQIVERVLAQNLSSPHIDVDHLKLAIEECVKPDILKSTETVFGVINAFDIPKIKYDLRRMKFVLETVTPDLYPEARHKSEIFKNRFELLWYRTLRHELFAPRKLGEKKDKNIELVRIEYLLSESRKESVCVMGLLTQLTEGQYYLEDTDGTIKVDLRRAISGWLNYGRLYSISQWKL